MASASRRWVAAAALTGAVVVFSAQAPELDVDITHREVADVLIDRPDLVEGSVVATVTASEPVEPAAEAPDFFRTAPDAFATRFPWDDRTSRGIHLENAAGETAEAWIDPAPPPVDPERHSVPVLQVTTSSPADLWDPATGIYVLGDHLNFEQRGRDWERPAQWRLSLDGTMLAEEPVGLRIHGGYSRNYHQKGLRFYFDHGGEEDALLYDVFADGGPAVFARLIARANRFDDVALNTNIAEGWMLDRGHLGSRRRFVALYLNDEYWGGYYLRERLDDEFFEVTHGWSGDFDLIKDGEVEEGDGDAWWALMDEIVASWDPTDPGLTARFESAVDLDSYLDWLCFNIFAAAGDNGFDHNLVLARPEGGRWTFVMWDEDLIFRDGDQEADLFRFFAARDEAEHLMHRAPSDFRPWTPEQQRWQSMLRRLLENTGFRSAFRDRFRDLLAGSLSADALIARLDDVVAEQISETPAHAERWEGFREFWYDLNRVRTRDWILERYAVVAAQLEVFLAEFRTVLPTVALGAVGPNPAPLALTIRFEGSAPAGAEVRVYDLRGRLIRRLEAAGLDGVVWDLRDGSGVPAPDGVYVLRGEPGGGTRKATVLR